MTTATNQMAASGSTANKSGALLEQMVEITVAQWFTDTLMTYADWKKAGKPAPVLVKHLPFTSIYGSELSKSEFGLVLPDGETVRIECKWQSSAGSVDEKFPYLLENMLTVPERRIVIIATGGGAKPQALEWLEREAPVRGQAAGKDIIVMTDVADFMAWAQKASSG